MTREKILNELGQAISILINLSGCLKKDSEASVKVFQLIKENETMPKNIRYKNGTYEGRKMLHGKIITVYASTIEDCQKLLEQKAKERQRAHSDVKLRALNDWLEEWLEVYKKPNISINSFQPLERCYRLHIPQELKQIPLVKLHETDIIKCLNRIENSRTKKYVYDFFHDALTKALKLRLIAFDIMAGVDPVKHKPKKGVALTIEEQTSFF